MNRRLGGDRQIAIIVFWQLLGALLVLEIVASVATMNARPEGVVTALAMALAVPFLFYTFQIYPGFRRSVSRVRLSKAGARPGTRGRRGLRRRARARSATVAPSKVLGRVGRARDPRRLEAFFARLPAGGRTVATNWFCWGFLLQSPPIPFFSIITRSPEACRRPQRSARPSALRSSLGISSKVFRVFCSIARTGFSSCTDLHLRSRRLASVFLTTPCDFHTVRSRHRFLHRRHRFISVLAGRREHNGALHLEYPSSACASHGPRRRPKLHRRRARGRGRDASRRNSVL